MVDGKPETAENIHILPAAELHDSTHRALYANIRGLRQGAGELAALIELEKPNFIFLTECHIAKDEPINMWIPYGYKVVCKRWRSKHGGGLLILAEEHLLCDPLDQKLMDKYHIDEAAELIGMKYGGVTYIDAYSSKSTLAKQLVGVLHRLRKDMPNDKFVIVGDFNVHNKDWIISESDTDEAGEMLEEFTQLNGMYQLIDFATRGNNALDLIISDLAGSASSKTHIGTSDHLSISFEIQVDQPAPQVEPAAAALNWRRAPWDHIRGAVKRAVDGWAPRASQSVNEAEAELDEKLWVVVKKHVKMRAPTKPRSRPWWTSLCRQAFKRKLQAFDSRREHPARYHNIKKHCTEIQRKAFADYNKKLSARLRTMEKSDKTFWDLTKEISGLQQPRHKAAPSADDLVDHFASKMPNGAEVYDNDWTPPEHWRGKAKLSSFKVHHRDVLKCLQSLDINKSINGIPNVMMKECALQLFEPLTKLYQYICKRGEFPARWKTGRITALHKRGAISSPKMYRPVQVLMNGELMFEGVIGPQLFSFLEKFIPTSQFGFIKKCGTQDYGALLVLLIFSSLEKGNEVLIIFLDVAGAFDRVWHAGLLKKLIAAGLQGKALRLMRDYLLRRFIKVVVGGYSSKERRIYSSVPQGGKWSAPLWDFEISTLKDLDLHGWLLNYADDCSLVYEISSTNRQSIIAAANQDLAALEAWGVTWLVSFEPTKTHSMVVSRKSSPFDPSGIYFMGENIEPVDEMKLVGFIFDPKMTMKPMVDHVARKARSKLSAICRLKQHLDHNNLEQMYKAFVRSSIEYGNLEYMSAGSSITGKLDRIQAAAERMGNFSVESLGSRRDAALIGFVFKLLDGDGKGMLNDFIPTVVQPVQSRTRRAKKMEIKRRLDFEETSKQYDRSIEGRITEVWSKIPEELLKVKEGDSWQSATKNCQRFLTGKNVCKQPVRNTGLNNRLNGKNNNKSLSTL